MNYTSTSELQTKEIAAEFARNLQGGEFIEIVGDLGAGKTVFVRGMVEALGSNARVKSPTFTIMNEYPVQGDHVEKIAHLDLYRFKDASELGALELEDYVNDKTVICVEWPDVFERSPFEPTHVVKIDHVDAETRKIDIKKL